MLKDKEYENAIRFYLDNTFDNSQKEIEVSDVLELNSEKALTRYIASNAPKGFKFSTPMFVWWDLTSACNFRCIHCLYNDQPYDDSNDLTDEEVYSLADFLIEDFHIVQAALTGGEIFLRPKTLMNLIKKFKNNNVGVILATNAALINDEHIEFLAKYLNPYTDRIQISLDGATSETFGKIRQTELFDKITSNIQKLTQRGLRVTCCCTVNSINYDEIVETYKLAEKLGASEFGAGSMLYFNESHAPLMVSSRDKMVLAQKLIQEKQHNKTRLNLGLFSSIELVNIPEVVKILEEEKYQKIFEQRIFLPARSCNKNDRLSIRSDGRIYMCMDAECPEGLMGNIREQSLSEIWANKDSNVFFEDRTPEKLGCVECKYRTYCNSGCMAKAFKRTGSINTPEIECRHCKVCK